MEGDKTRGSRRGKERERKKKEGERKKKKEKEKGRKEREDRKENKDADRRYSWLECRMRRGEDRVMEVTVRKMKKKELEK
jgi:hypothetical protein